ncbi:13600_t:CDS:2, partial [Racocetra persica]
MASKSIEWLEKAISEQFINQYSYEEFSGYQILGEGASGEVRKFEWKNYNLMVVHKSLKGFTEMDEMNEEKIKTLVKELRLMQQICSFPNIINFYGVTKALHIEKLHMNANSDDNLLHKVSLQQSQQSEQNGRLLIHRPPSMSDYSLPYEGYNINVNPIVNNDDLVRSNINSVKQIHQRINSGNNLIRSRTSSDKSEKESMIDMNSIHTNSDMRSMDESTLHPDEFFINETSTDKLIIDNGQ